MVNQTQILTLLNELKVDFGLSYLFITHDVKAAYSISDKLCVMENGEIIEQCEEKQKIFTSNQPAVKELLSSILAEHPRDRVMAEDKKAVML